VVVRVCPAQGREIENSEAVGPRVGPCLQVLLVVNAGYANHLPVADDGAGVVCAPGRSLDGSGEPVEGGEGEDVDGRELCLGSVVGFGACCASVYEAIGFLSVCAT
jgi:hypothetical protein